MMFTAPVINLVLNVNLLKIDPQKNLLPLELIRSYDPPPPLLKQGLEKMPKESCSEQIKWRKVWKNQIEKKRRMFVIRHFLGQWNGLQM